MIEKRRREGVEQEFGVVGGPRIRCGIKLPRGGQVRRADVGRMSGLRELLVRAGRAGVHTRREAAVTCRWSASAEVDDSESEHTGGTLATERAGKQTDREIRAQKAQCSWAKDRCSILWTEMSSQREYNTMVLEMEEGCRGVQSVACQEAQTVLVQCVIFRCRVISWLPSCSAKSTIDARSRELRATQRR
jgi:hypothetical protein